MQGYRREKRQAKGGGKETIKEKDDKNSGDHNCNEGTGRRDAGKK